ncbi:MAG: hypothetical protein Q9215_004592 [Flavoplaca cf. flavocitrina]
MPKQRTHRSLHSAFWSHGAGNIDLPSWWLAFLQVPSSRDQIWSFDKYTSEISPSPPDTFGFLDFLYPGETLAFIRKCMSGNASAVRRRRPSQLPLQRSRPYTSAADASNEVRPSQEHTAQSTDIQESGGLDFNIDQLDGEAGRELRADFKRMLRDHEISLHTRDLWQKYEETRRMSLTLSSRDYCLLFERLRASETPFDAKCMENLLGDIPLPTRNYLHYDHAIFAALEQKDLEGAMHLHREAAGRFPYMHGSSMLLKYTVQHCRWKCAEEIWKHHLDRERAHVWQPDIREGVKTLPTTELMARATEAARNASRHAQASSSDDAVITRSLAISLMRRALSTWNVEFHVPTQHRMLSASCRIQPPDLSIFKAAVLQNLSLGRQNRKHNDAALELYREIRGKRELTPDLELSMKMLHRFSAIRDSQGMYEVLEDFRKRHESMPEKAYSIIMPQLARHGDFDTVNGLFYDFIDRYGKGEILKHARNLFYACFRRADADTADSVLQSLQRTYDYEPDLEARNILIATYARVGDCDGAMSLFEKLIAANITPNNSTYGILMSLSAKRSDYDTASALYEQAVSTGIKPNVLMVDSLVLALVSCDRFDEAYQVVQEALTMNFDDAQKQSHYFAGFVTRTRMWNTLLSYCAMNKRLDKVAEIQKHMHEAGVPHDKITYANLMLSLCIKNMPGSALRIKNTIMRGNGVRPTALHYSILMGGFMSTNEPSKVLQLADEMLKNNINPTFSTQNHLLRVASKIDEQQDNQENDGDQPFLARRAEEVMKQALETLNPMELAPIGPTMRAQSNPVNVAFYSTYFSYMIYLYGKKQSFNRVVSIYDEYISVARKMHGNAEILPPVELLSALMVAHLKAGEYAETERCWQLAMEKSETLARKAAADTSQAGWVLHRYRFILSLPLTRYMQSLHESSRVGDIATTIDHLLHAGYRLSVHNWNKYSQILAQEGQFLLAFEICEKHLMDGWPGWEHFGNSNSAKRKVKKHWSPRSLDRGRPFPNYETLVYLAGLYLDFKSKPYGTGRGTLEDLERLAPRTMEAIIKMPNFDDEIQNSNTKAITTKPDCPLLAPAYSKIYQMGTNARTPNAGNKPKAQSPKQKRSKTPELQDAERQTNTQ